jgi:thioredoxin reductase
MPASTDGYGEAMAASDVDALVIGGGPAGLSAALWLARLRCRTLVADRGEPRNRWADRTYGYLGFDGQPPGALLDAGRAELRRYEEAELAPVGARSLHRADGHFEAELDDRRVRAAAVIVATGVVDAVPPLAGLREHYGTQVFVCPLCDGYEMRGRAVAVVGAGGNAGAFAQELLRWASDVTVVPLGDERPTDAVTRPARLADAPARAVLDAGDRLTAVELRDGERVPCDAVFLRSEVIGVTDLATHLGCELTDEGLLQVDEEGRTTVDCVYAAGDCTPGPHLVQVAAAQGARAGLHCAQQLVARR